MTKLLDDVDPMARRLALVIRGLADEEVNRRLAAKVAALTEKQRSRQDRLMEACRAVATAVDRLDEQKFTSREIASRQKVTEAATRLRNLMLGKRAKPATSPGAPRLRKGRNRGGRYTPGPSGRAILRAVAETRVFRAEEQRHMASCMKLHVAGLLDRDAKDAALFLANARGIAWVQSNGSGA